MKYDLLMELWVESATDTPTLNIEPTMVETIRYQQVCYISMGVKSYIDVAFHDLVLVGLGHGTAGDDSGGFSFSHDVRI